MFTSNSDPVSAITETADFSQAPPFAAIARHGSLSARLRPPRDESALAAVLSHPGIWRRGTATRVAADIEPTGIADLDARLPGGGWPRSALSEILIEHDGIGECSLVLPALARADPGERTRRLHRAAVYPYAPALVAAGIDLAQIVHIEAGAADMHWTAEQCLRAGCCGAVLNWLPDADYRQLRRLQLASDASSRNPPRAGPRWHAVHAPTATPMWRDFHEMFTSAHPTLKRLASQHRIGGGYAEPAHCLNQSTQIPARGDVVIKSKIGVLASVALLALGLAACGSSNRPAAPRAPRPRLPRVGQRGRSPAPVRHSRRPSISNGHRHRRG